MSPDAQVEVDALREERTSAYLYEAMEAAEEPARAKLFAKLRAASERQAALWEDRLAASGVAIPPYTPPLRARIVAVLIRRLGPRPILPVLASMKVRGLAIYRSDGIPMAQAGHEHEALPFTPVSETESWHHGQQRGGALRAAVFGINDGLVSNASLIVGVSGAGSDAPTVMIAGLSGLLAGSLSMATGEYVSVKTQRELFEHQIALERHELETMPEEEVEELAEIYAAKGLSRDTARAVASQLIANPSQGLDTLAREELGLNPNDLVSPVWAAAASFASFAIGALIPLLPFITIRLPSGLFATIIAMECGLLVVGGMMSLFTGRNAVWSAIRMALLGSAAAAATFVIGRLFGAATGTP